MTEISYEKKFKNDNQVVKDDNYGPSERHTLDLPMQQQNNLINANIANEREIVSKNVGYRDKLHKTKNPESGQHRKQD